MLPKSPLVVDRHVSALLDKMKVDFEPEIVPVKIEAYAKPRNCYINVDEKVLRDGGSVHYGWIIWKSKILCEAERHAVWENEFGDLIDITPQEEVADKVMFVSDNDFIYSGQSVDNIRLNITNNPVVDDFIYLCELIEKFFTFCQRIDDESVSIPPNVAPYINKYQILKSNAWSFIHTGGKMGSSCYCGSIYTYSKCHGKNLRDIGQDDLRVVLQAFSS